MSGNWHNVPQDCNERRELDVCARYRHMDAKAMSPKSARRFWGRDMDKQSDTS